jgi:hypothetical protein
MQRDGAGDEESVLMRVGLRVGAVLCVLATGALRAQSSGAARQVVDAMLVHESNPGEHHNKYMYVSEERSERTGGHLWKERVVETTGGKVRLLIAEDGQPLSGNRLAAEKARLAEIAAHPDAFQRREQTMKNDEQHAEQMLALLHKAFMFEAPRVEGGDLRIDYRPDPAYQPQSLEERVLHAMEGEILVDERTMELHKIEGRVPADVSLGYGLLGTIHAGSGFSTAHEMEPGNEWKASVVDTAINGKAIFFKAIGRNEHVVHSGFTLLPNDISVPQAVNMLERSGP